VTRLNADGTGLIYSTFIGGSAEEGFADFVYPENLRYMGVTLHGSGDFIVGGVTLSGDFPTTPGAYRRTTSGGRDAFVTRLNATGSALVYSTYLGGDVGDGALCVAVDGSGVVTAGGWTWSSNFPTTAGAYDRTFNSIPGSSNDGFVTRLNPDGSDLLYSTFIGGSSHEPVYELAVDDTGDVFMTGLSRSEDFPTTPDAFDSSLHGEIDAFLCHLSPDRNGEDDLVYSTLIGGSGQDGGQGLVLIDAVIPTIVFGGFSEPYGFPCTPGAYDMTLDGPWDGFVCRFGPSTVGIPEAAARHGVQSARLGPVSPNPNHGNVNYSVDLPHETTVQVHVFDIAGRKVQTLLDERLPAGLHGYSENLRAGEGHLAGGVYYLRMEANGVEESRKFILVR
jgi:hypothetical protein